MDIEHTEDERTDPMVSDRRRGPSPTPVSHVGASARTVAPSSRIGGSTPGTELRADTGGRSTWIPIVLGLVGLALIGGVVAAAVVLPDRLGAWASSPEAGAASALEPVPIEDADEP